MTPPQHSQDHRGFRRALGGYRTRSQNVPTRGDTWGQDQVGCHRIWEGGGGLPPQPPQHSPGAGRVAWSWAWDRSSSEGSRLDPPSVEKPPSLSQMGCSIAEGGPWGMSPPSPQPQCPQSSPLLSTGGWGSCQPGGHQASPGGGGEGSRSSPPILGRVGLGAPPPHPQPPPASCPPHPPAGLFSLAPGNSWRTGGVVYK